MLVTTVSSVALARRGEASLWDDGMFYVYYTGGFPLVIFACVQLLELWLHSLPAQVKSEENKRHVDGGGRGGVLICCLSLSFDHYGCDQYCYFHYPISLYRDRREVVRV